MAPPRTFIGFSSTDIHYYKLMLAWKANENIDFDFCDCQLQSSLNSDNEKYIKDKCRDRLYMAGTYAMLIGNDTRHKYKYVTWEAEVAIEKQCRIIGINLDGWRYINKATCPRVLQNVGAIFVPFSPQIVAHALEHHDSKQSQNWHFQDHIYTNLGYVIVDNRAERPKPLPPLPYKPNLYKSR